MTSNEQTTISATTGSLGELLESPYWSAKTSTVSFVDIPAGRLWHHRSEESKTEIVYEGEQDLSAAIPGMFGETMLAQADGIYLLDSSGRVDRLVDTRLDAPNSILNDAKIGPLGDIWVGRMSATEEPGRGELLRISSGDVTVVRANLTIPNGIAWSPDLTTMYFVDSPTGRVDRIDFSIERGIGRNNGALMRVQKRLGIPDGLCVDTQGGIWVSFYGGGAVRRFDLFGRLTYTIRLPVTQVTSCCFGGDDRHTLYVTTGREGFSEQQREAEPLAGALFSTKVPFQGMPVWPFSTL